MKCQPTCSGFSVSQKPHGQGSHIYCPALVIAVSEIQRQNDPDWWKQGSGCPSHEKTDLGSMIWSGWLCLAIGPCNDRKFGSYLFIWIFAFRIHVCGEDKSMQLICVFEYNQGKMTAKGDKHNYLFNNVLQWNMLRFYFPWNQHFYFLVHVSMKTSTLQEKSDNIIFHLSVLCC